MPSAWVKVLSYRPKFDTRASEVIMELARILKELCEERGITISTLSKRTTVPQQTLHNWISGVEPKSFTQVKKVAEFFNVTFDYLCFGTEIKKTDDITSYKDEINAGVFEVVLRRLKDKRKS